MSITVDIQGPINGERFFDSVENLRARTQYGIQKAWWRSAKDIQGEFNRQVLAKDKTGRIYIRRNRAGARLRHQSSAPGQTPANRTGNYRRSFGFSVGVGSQTGDLTIGNSAPYALPLEIGTSRMSSRPGLRNSIRSSERSIIRNLTEEIEWAL